MPFWKKKKPKKKGPPKPKPKSQTALAPARSLPQFEQKPFIPPEMPRPYIPRIMQPTKQTPPKFQHDAEKEFLKVFKELTYRHRGWDVWNDFIVMAACALSNPVDKAHCEEREARYLRIIKKYSKEEQQKFPTLFAQTVMALELNPEQDFLGRLYTRLGLQDDGRKQHFTPYNVCVLMAELAMGDVVKQVRENGYVTLDDPCCGAGATLIAGINCAKKSLEKACLNFQNHILVTAQDIDETVALMCYIQLSLLGVAAYIKIGNTLTEPMTSGDPLENYWFTPMYFSDVWAMRRAIHQMEELFQRNRELGN